MIDNQSNKDISHERHIGHDIWDYVQREKELIDKKESLLSRSDRDEIIRLHYLAKDKK